MQSSTRRRRRLVLFLAAIMMALGGVTLTRGQSSVNGGRLVLDLDTGRAVMDGGGAPGTTSQGGRVTGTFTVPPRKGG